MAISLAFLWLPQSCNAQGTPDADWFRGYPLYEVYVRSFSPQGSFQALGARLEDMRLQGIENLWLMPIYPIGVLDRKGAMGSPYSVRNYFDVGSEYGNKDDFRRLVQAAHQKGMRVILDMVINHSANDHIEMGQHPEWFYRDSTGAFSREVADWSDITDWDFSSAGCRAYLDSVLIYWIREFDVDGYRCDVAGLVPDDFWKNILPRLRALKPDLFLLAEWESAQMHRDGFDATYDWTLYHRLVGHYHGRVSLDSLWQAVEQRRDEYPPNALPLRFIENHDQERAISVFGRRHYRPYADLIFTLPGIPLIYSGQEIGADHRPSLFEKEPIEWDKALAEVKRHYNSLIYMRHDLPILLTGDLRRISVPVEDVLVFQRFGDDAEALIAINFADRAAIIPMPDEISKAGKTWQIYEAQANREKRPLQEIRRLDRIELEPLGFEVLLARGKNE